MVDGEGDALQQLQLRRKGHNQRRTGLERQGLAVQANEGSTQVGDKAQDDHDRDFIADMRTNSIILGKFKSMSNNTPVYFQLMHVSNF